MTVVPYHDSIIDKSQKSLLVQVKMHNLTDAIVKNRKMLHFSF